MYGGCFLSVVHRMEIDSGRSWWTWDGTESENEKWVNEEEWTEGQNPGGVGWDAEERAAQGREELPVLSPETRIDHMLFCGKWP